MLLLVLGLIIRLGFKHPTDFDSMWIQGMAETINNYHYAKWVYHPMSLFGYYPLSYPSALMYLLAVVSTITGLSMNNTIYFTGIFFGLAATIYVYLIGRYFGEHIVGFLAAFIFLLSPIVITFSSYVASGRFLLVFFSLAVLTFLMRIFEIVEKGLTCYDKLTFFQHNTKIAKVKIFIKYWITIFILLIYMFMIHRTAQLSLIILLSALISYFIYKMPIIWKILKKIKIVQNLFVKRYKHWNKWVLIDFVVVVGSLGTYKVISLIYRGRLLINVERYFPWVVLLAQKIQPLSTIIIFTSLLILIIIGFIIYFKLSQLAQILNRLNNFYLRIYNLIQKDLNLSLFKSLLVILVVVFLSQFFGKSFYSPSIKDYSETIFFKGDNPIIIFLNFLINFTSSVSVYSIFTVIGITALFLKEKKNLNDLLIIFTVLAFAGILLDKNYVRLFITPILALISAISIVRILKFVQNKFNEKYFKITIMLIILIGPIGAFVPQIRERITGKSVFFDFRQQYWNTGQYILGLDCDCSTITTDEQVAGVTIFASSGIPGGTHSIYYFVDEDHLKPNLINYNEFLFNIRHGVKVTELWHLPDWIFGGEYYIGRHAINLFKRDYSNPLVQRVIKDYRMRYYIHDEVLEKPIFLISIIPLKNKIYANGLANVYDLNNGR